MWLADTLKSLVSGLGTSKDKTTSLAYVFAPITDEQLNAMHRSDWLARKIVDIIPHDMTREWREWQATNPQIEAIEEVEKRPAQGHAGPAEGPPARRRRDLHGHARRHA